MAGPVNIIRLSEYINRITRDTSAGAKKASRVYVEYYDDSYQTHRRRPAQSVRMEQTEHGPLTLIISEQDS